jgi:hypothetical protein
VNTGQVTAGADCPASSPVGAAQDAAPAGARQAWEPERGGLPRGPRARAVPRAVPAAQDELPERGGLPEQGGIPERDELQAPGELPERDGRVARVPRARVALREPGELQAPDALRELDELRGLEPAGFPELLLGSRQAARWQYARTTEQGPEARR